METLFIFMKIYEEFSKNDRYSLALIKNLVTMLKVSLIIIITVHLEYIRVFHRTNSTLPLIKRDTYENQVLAITDCGGGHGSDRNSGVRGQCYR